MIGEVISFGGYWKNVAQIIRERRKHTVRIKAESDEKTVLVKIQIKQRDTRKTVKNETGKEVENERYGKFYYETYDSLEIEQATGPEVKEAVLRGISAAAKK